MKKTIDRIKEYEGITRYKKPVTIEAHREIAKKAQKPSKSILKIPSKKTGRKRKLTLKQRKFIKYYLECGNLTESARLAGYQATSYNSLRQIGHQCLTKLNLPIQELMDEMGITDQRLLAKLSEGLNAELVKIASHEGIITDEKTYIDYPTRAKYLDMGLKVKGHYKETPGQGGIFIQKLNQLVPTKIYGQKEAESGEGIENKEDERG